MISLEWLNDYINIEKEDIKELTNKITQCGVNIEKVISNHIDNLVIGEIISCIDHENSDHLHVCKVNVGKEVVQIVCGAPNVREGLKVIVSLPGAILPGGFEIKASTIRGVESYGMICALYELGLEEKTDETYSKGICELNDDAVVGENPLKYLNLEDTILELDVHKHRNNDCYYHIGFAYEVGAILDKKVKTPKSDYKEINESINDIMNLEVKTSKCPYYAAKMVKNVVIKESPDFIKRRLISCGMRPINNVVDISNYVMLEYGQPMHFFDKEKLGDNILVRDALDNEKIITLDGKERTLLESDIVITDRNKPVCIAGVMGGENTGDDNNTKTILIESAIFDAVSIRNTSSRLDLKSEASIRYGKGLNYEYSIEALNRACHLLEKYADAEILSGVLLHDTIDKKEKHVKFITKDINKMLGITLNDKDVEKQLQRLQFTYTLNKDLFDVIIPSRRLDIDNNINDVAEEIGRLYGYHNLVSTIPFGSFKRGEYIGNLKYSKMISKRLRTLGLNEIKTYTLISPDEANMYNYENVSMTTLPNPMSVDKSVIRTSLLSSLIKTYNYNKSRKVNDIMLYEISKTYDADYKEDIKVGILISGNYISNMWENKKIENDFFVLKGIIENLLDYLGYKNRYEFVKNNISILHPGINASIMFDRNNIGIIGKLHPSITKDDIFVAELSITKLISNIKPLKYKPASKYPSITKDVAFVVDNNIEASQIINEIKKVSSKMLTDITIFDLYKMDDKKSLAFSLKFESNERTLTDEEVTSEFNKIIDTICKKYNANIRK